MSNNTVMINDSSYIFEDMTEKAQVSYQQLLSLRNQMADLSMKQQQIAAAQSVFEKALEEELAEQPAEAELTESEAMVAEGQQMWSSPLELYPVHVSPTIAPQGTALVVEPQVIREQDYMRVQPPSKPYMPTAYSTLHWVAKA